MATRFEEPENRSSERGEDLHNGTDQAQAAIDFEELLGDLSSSFVRISIEEIDSEVERWLEKITLAMGADRRVSFRWIRKAELCASRTSGRGLG
jgi:hypothetical protein